jgi:hypothetical protein
LSLELCVIDTKIDYHMEFVVFPDQKVIFPRLTGSC